MRCQIMSAARVRVDLTARLLLCGAVTSPVHWAQAGAAKLSGTQG